MDQRQIVQMVSAHGQSRVVMIAVKLGLFEPLAGRPLTAAELSRRLKISLKGVERLSGALVALGLLDRRGRRYALSGQNRRFLTREGEASLVNMILLSETFWSFWTDLERMIRTGRPLVSMMRYIRSRPGMLQLFVHGMRDRAKVAAHMIADRVDLSTVRSVLDLGGGPGVYALEWAKRHPDLRAVVYDIPPVLKITRRYIREYGLRQRVVTAGGDFNRHSIGNGYDLILAANVLQMNGPTENRRLLKKAYRALNPGGRIIIHGFMTDRTGRRPREAAMFALTIGLVTPDGHAYPVPEVAGWMRKAGFKRPSLIMIDVIPPTVIVGEK
jgi:SAM-dependent methyltransferase